MTHVFLNLNVLYVDELALDVKKLDGACRYDDMSNKL